jgi:predicted transcriptional regulator
MEDRITMESRHLLERDHRSRRIAEVAAAKALEDVEGAGGGIRGIALTAALNALAMVYEEDGELYAARYERDKYKALYEELSKLAHRPVTIPIAEINPPGDVEKGIPIYASRDATDDVLGKDGE